MTPLVGPLSPCYGAIHEGPLAKLAMRPRHDIVRSGRRSKTATYE